MRLITRRRAIATVLGAASCTALAPFAAAREHTWSWLELYNTHTRERLRTTFLSAVGFVPTALRKLQFILRDHRTGQQHEMDQRLYMLLADLAAAAGVEPRYEIISGYRSVATNEFLRTHVGGQAKHSQHTYGRAIDLRLVGVPTARLRDLAVELQRGGVGYYARSDFLHVDTARVRYWEG